MWTFMQASDAGEGSREAWWSLQTGFYTRRLRAERKLNSGFSHFGSTTPGLAGESKIVDPKIGPIVSNALVELIVDGSHGRCMQRLRESGHWQLTRQ
jgi:hypothetical protein